MKRITEDEYQVCKRHGLLYDGKNLYKGLDKQVERHAHSGRTFVRTRNNVYISEGSDGVYDKMLSFKEKDAKKNGAK
jgi:hypothetical protein